MRPGKTLIQSFILIVTLTLSCRGEVLSQTVIPDTSTAEAITIATFIATAMPTPIPVSDTATPPPPPVIALEAPTGSPAGNEEFTTPTRVITDLIGPHDFPQNVNPLTGLTLPNPAKLDRRPIAVKVSNAPPIVRPQTGLNQADLVFEHYAEGGFTRFTAVFYSQDAETVGSIRSGRLIDLEIPVMYDAAFAYSGSSGPVRLMFMDSPFFDRIISPDFGHGGFYRLEDANTAFEHTLFTNTFNLHFILGERGQDGPPNLQNGMAFRHEPPFPGEPATRIEIPYDATTATWFYSNGRYLRWTDGDPHLDAATNTQLSFNNIIVLAAHHEETDILEDTVGDGHYSIQIQIWGEGPVSIFRDGQRIDGRWQRQDPTHMLTFTDLDGNILPLAPGNSFFQIIPLGFDRLHVTP